MIIHHDLENILKFTIHSNVVLEVNVIVFYLILCFILFRKSIIGAKLSDFLLEKSRIVTHSNDERNYHVFYELLEGFDADEKRKYGLTTPEKYFYLNQVHYLFITKIRLKTICFCFYSSRVRR